jgi:hypothetical protein
VLSTVEPGLGIIAGSLCTLRPLLRYVKCHLKERKNPNYSSTDPASAEVFALRRGRDTEKGDGTLQGSITLALTTVDSTKSKAGHGKTFLISTIDQSRAFQEEALRTVDRRKQASIEEEEEPGENERHPVPEEEPSSQDVTEMERRSIDEETSRSIRAKRATWWPMTRTSITQMNQLSTTSSIHTQHDPDDFSWLDLRVDNKE